MRRRALIAALGAVATWPVTARAAAPAPMRRLGVLSNKAQNDPEAANAAHALERGLQERGWAVGANIAIEYRWGAGDPSLYKRYTAELIVSSPDILLAEGGTIVGALQQATSAIPIVFVGTSDPVNRGLVASIARPGANTTGFIQWDFNLSGKWIELLKQISPGTKRVAVIRDPAQASGIGELAVIEAAAPSLSVDVSPIDARDSDEIERAISAFAHGTNSGLIVTASGAAEKHRKMIITLAAQHHIPAVYPYRYFVVDGGLISYGVDTADQFRVATSYIDRILKGEKPADLPVQAPTKYELAINVTTAKTLGLTVPPSLLAAADEVIE